MTHAVLYLAGQNKYRSKFIG